MRSPHDIDNEEPLFEFDSFEEHSIAASLSIGSRPISTVALPKPMFSLDRSGESGISSSSSAGKGKERTPTKPVPIRAPITIHDLFDFSPEGTNPFHQRDGQGSSMAFSPNSSSSSFGLGDSFRRGGLSIDSMEGMESPASDFSSVMEPSSTKGKERESFPVLPPLTFSMMQLDYAQITSPSAGPSSYEALFGPPSTTVNLPLSLPSSSGESDLENLPHFPLSNPVSSAGYSQSVSRPHVTRSRSLSILSQDLSTTLDIVSTFNPHISYSPSNAPSNISRQLFLDKDNETLDSVNKPSGLSSARPDLIRILTDPRPYPPAWYTVSKPLTASTKVVPHVATSAHAVGTLKGKARSKSYPISALDYVPITTSDIFQPIPIVVINYFDRVLPRELRLRILTALLELHEQDYARSVVEGRLTMAKATSSKGRWVGKDKGIRELFKLSRVSKGWQALVLDGELWASLDFHSFPGIPPALLTKVAKAAGAFVRSLNFAGHVQLLPDALSDLTNNISLIVPNDPLSYTQLTSINLQGCTYLTTRSIHHLLVHSKSLQTLCLKGLGTVTNATCEIIANHLPNLISLNLSRCANVDGYGISAMTHSIIARKGHIPMKELRLSGLKYVTDSVMRALGRTMPHLEVLDLSYARQLHNSALEAFVACDSLNDDAHPLQAVVVSARELGRDASESGRFRRRVTKLRHLVLSSCYLLTDDACSNLAYSVPDLEFLELAGVGADLKDEGIIRLLSTTPNIRRLDLEDAIEITDALISALTPPTTPPSATKAPKLPGHALEYLNISFASNVSEDALIYLIRSCPRLNVLEADNTRLGADALREFVKLSRERTRLNARIVAIDCRGISEGVVKELAGHTRPRLGWRAYGARRLLYLDGRDADGAEELALALGQDECDAARVVLKTFYSWQTVSAVQAAKEKRRRMASRRTASDSSADAGEGGSGASLGRAARWWSPSGRRAPAGRNSPVLPELNNDGCRTM